MCTQLSTVKIPLKALEFKFVRSSGPGGQNVNKVATAVQLRLDLRAWPELDEHTKQRLKTLAGRKLTDDEQIVISAQRLRTQEQNKRDALERLQQLVDTASIVPKKRRATKPSRGEKARRLDNKRRRSEVKRTRGHMED
jgi:ribosome-associated protein